MPNNEIIIECGCYRAESNTCGMDLLICAETACPYGKYVEAPDPPYHHGRSPWFWFMGKKVMLVDEDGNVNWRLAFALP